MSGYRISKVLAYQQSYEVCLARMQRKALEGDAYTLILIRHNKHTEKQRRFKPS